MFLFNTSLKVISLRGQGVELKSPVFYVNSIVKVSIFSLVHVETILFGAVKSSGTLVVKNSLHSMPLIDHDTFIQEEDVSAGRAHALAAV